jgi:hypothetical protein
MFSANELGRMMVVPVLIFGSVCAALGYGLPKLVMWLWTHLVVSWQ